MTRRRSTSRTARRPARGRGRAAPRSSSSVGRVADPRVARPLAQRAAHAVEELLVLELALDVGVGEAVLAHAGGGALGVEELGVPRAVVERAPDRRLGDEHPVAVAAQRQLVDHPLVEQADDVGARADDVARVGERLLQRARPAEPLAPLEHEHRAARPGRGRRRTSARCGRRRRRRRPTSVAASSAIGAGSPTRPSGVVDRRRRAVMRAGRAAKRSRLAAATVDVVSGVLDRQRPLLHLPPRREEHAAVVLVQPVGVAVAGVVAAEVAVVADAHRREDDRALGAVGADVAGQAVAAERCGGPASTQLLAQLVEVGVGGRASGPRAASPWPRPSSAGCR